MMKTALILTAASVLFVCGPMSSNAQPAAEKTTITGSKMKLIKKGRSAEFTGNVRMTRGTDFMSAERMITDDVTHMSHAWDKVYLRRDDVLNGIRWEIWADEALYDTGFSSGTLWAKSSPVRVQRTPLASSPYDDRLWIDTEKIVMYDAYPATGPRVSGGRSQGGTAISSATTCVNFYRRVYAKYDEGGAARRTTEIWSRDGKFFGPSAELDFSGGYPWSRRWTDTPVPHILDEKNPVARQNDGGEWRHLKGQKMTYFLGTGRWIVEKSVYALIFRNKTEN